MLAGSTAQAANTAERFDPRQYLLVVLAHRWVVLIVLLLFIVDWRHIYEALTAAPPDASLLTSCLCLMIKRLQT